MPPPKNIRDPPHQHQTHAQADSIHQRNPNIIRIRPDIVVDDIQDRSGVTESRRCAHQAHSDGEDGAEEVAAAEVACGEGGGVDGRGDGVQAAIVVGIVGGMVRRVVGGDVFGVGDVAFFGVRGLHCRLSLMGAGGCEGGKVER